MPADPNAGRHNLLAAGCTGCYIADKVRLSSCSLPPSLPPPFPPLPVRWHPHRPLCRRRHLQDSDWILGERAIGAVEPPSEEDDDPLAQVDIHQVCVFAFTSLSFTLCVHREGSQLLSLHRVTVYTPSMRRG